MVVGFTATCAITKVVSSNLVHGEVYSIQHYVKVCLWLETGWWFSLGTPVSSTNKTNRHDITEILLKVALNTISHKLITYYTYLNRFDLGSIWPVTSHSHLSLRVLLFEGRFFFIYGNRAKIDYIAARWQVILMVLLSS